MAEATQSTAATLDAAAVTKLIADAVKPLSDALVETTKNQKILADTYAADTKARADAEAAAKAEAAKGDKKPAEPAAAAKPLTAEEITKLVTDSIAATTKAQADAAKSTAAREAYVADKLKGVPAAYHGKLGADPTKWAAEEQSIRDGLKADLAAMGIVVKNVGGGEAGGITTSGGGAVTAPPEKVAQYKAAGLSDGEAAFATGIKLPG